MRPPSGVNLTALLSRFSRICSSLSRSPRAFSPAGTSISSVRFFLSDCGSIMGATALATSYSSTSSMK
jgi:hypothetical protein